jgi:hypothetical protein
MGTSEQRTVTLFVSGRRVKEGSIEVRDLEVLVAVLRLSDNVDDDLTKPSVMIRVMNFNGGMLVEAFVSTAVLEVVRVLSRKCIVPSRCAEPRRDPEQEQRKREQKLWAMAKQMYRGGFGQKPEEWWCSVEQCPEHTVPPNEHTGPRARQPAIAVDSTGVEWPICRGHFDAGQFVDGLAKKTEAAIEAAVRDDDAPAIDGQNKVMEAIKRLGDPIIVFANSKAREAAKPKGVMAAALEKAAAGKPSGRGPAKQVAKPDQAP